MWEAELKENKTDNNKKQSFENFPQVCIMFNDKLIDKFIFNHVLSTPQDRGTNLAIII